MPTAGLVLGLILNAESCRLFVVAATRCSAYIPVINPIVTVYFIRPYRYAIFGTLFDVTRKSHHVVAASVAITDGSLRISEANS